MPQRRKQSVYADQQLTPALRARLRPPVAIVLGAPAATAQLLASLEGLEATCYQLDLYQAERLSEELSSRGVRARVVTSPDLWDLTQDFQTVLYPVPPGGER